MRGEENKSVEKCVAIAINDFMRKYQRSAKNKKREFCLTRSDFIKITSSNCVFCDSPPSNKYKYKNSKFIGVYFYNGIDRIDSAKGYSLDNVIPCCETCNRMKLDINILDFIKKIYEIRTHQKEN